MMDWYRNLPQRDQLFAMVGSFVVIVTLIFLLIIEPLQKRKDQAETKYKAAISLNEFMLDTSKQVNVLRQQLKTQKPVVAVDKLLGLINNSMKSSGISKELTSLSPGKNNIVRLRFDDVNFDIFMSWLVRFHNQYGVNVETLSISNTSNTGRVKVSVLIN